jgi:hypothetical protein
MISYADLIEVFKKCAIYAGINREWFDSMTVYGLPYISRYIIFNLWLKELPDNSYTRVMREQILYLEKHGHLNVEKD